MAARETSAILLVLVIKFNPPPAPPCPPCCCPPPPCRPPEALPPATVTRAIIAPTADWPLSRPDEPPPPVAPPAPPTRLARLADVLVLVVGVADLAHGGEAADVDPPDLPGGHPHGGEVALLGDQLGRDAGAAHQLAAPAGEHLEVVDGRAERDVGERQGVAGLDLGADTGADDGPDGQPQGGEDVPLLAVGVVQEGDPGAPVGVVLDRRDPGDHVVLGAPEVDHPVELGMAAPAVTHRDPAGVVAAARLLEVDGEAALPGGAGHLLEGADGHEPAASAGRLVFVDWHRSIRPRTVRGSSAREPASPPPSSSRGSSRSAGCRCRAGTGGCAPCPGWP